jgi:RNA polymerase sigma factor (sigma-70 family)
MLNQPTLDGLAERAKAGDRSALEELVRGLQDRLYRISLRFLGNPAHAHDATQEVLILVITQLGSFRGESAVSTWAYRIATRHLLRQRSRWRESSFESLAEDDLGQPPNAVEPQTLASAEERLLEEEIFVGCTQAMLQALDAPHRIAFVLGAILELEARDAAAVLELSEVAFRKRLSRARETLDGFVSRHCGVANPANACRCRYQVNHNVRHGRMEPKQLRFAVPVTQTSLEALRAHGEIQKVRRSLELYRAQREFVPPEDFAERVRRLLEASPLISSS